MRSTPCRWITASISKATTCVGRRRRNSGIDNSTTIPFSIFRFQFSICYDGFCHTCGLILPASKPTAMSTDTPTQNNEKSLRQAVEILNEVVANTAHIEDDARCIKHILLHRHQCSLDALTNKCEMDRILGRKLFFRLTMSRLVICGC